MTVLCLLGKKPISCASENHLVPNYYKYPQLVKKMFIKIGRMRKQTRAVSTRKQIGEKTFEVEGNTIVV